MEGEEMTDKEFIDKSYKEFLESSYIVTDSWMEQSFTDAIQHIIDTVRYSCEKAYYEHQELSGKEITNAILSAPIQEQGK